MTDSNKPETLYPCRCQNFRLVETYADCRDNQHVRVCCLCHKTIPLTNRPVNGSVGDAAGGTVG